MSRLLQNNPLLFLDAVTACHQASFEHPWSRADFQALLELPTTRLWTVEDGFLLCSEVADEMEILTLCVMPSSRRQGVASSLLSAMKAYADDCGISRVFLEVAINNLPAQHLYKKMGFVSNGIRPNYYRQGTKFVDAQCLVLNISS